MTDEPKHKESPSPNDEAFEEALDAAEVFSDLANEDKALRVGEGLEDEALEGGAAGAQGDAYGAESDAFADEFELPAPQLAAAAVETEALAAAEADAGSVDEVAAPTPEAVGALAFAAPSIGELFKPVVKHSPPSKIRIEADSIGALFHRFIEQG